MKNSLLFGFLSVILLNCEDINVERTIDKNDYYVEYGSDNSELYRFNDKKKMTGTFKVTKNNQLTESFFVKEGRLYDAYKTYHPNGSVATESIYLKGLKNGHEKVFYPSGKLRSKYAYRNGEKTNASVSYYENGAVQNKTNSNGTTEYFHEDGTVFSHSTSENNKIFKDGKLNVEEYDYEHETGTINVIKTYNEDGSISKIIGFRMDEEMYSENNMYLLVLDENHTLLDSVNPQKDMQKFMKIIQELGPEITNGFF